MASRRTAYSSLFLGTLVIGVLTVAGIAAFYLSGKNTETRAAASSAQDFANGFVARSGTKFILNGQEFKFVGFNIFDAANTYFPDQKKMGYSCPRENGWWGDIYTESNLDLALKTMKQQSGANVLRFWAFQRYTNGGTDWSGIDKVIRVAKNNGFKVLPVLENGPAHCTYPAMDKWKYNNDSWYTDGYKQKMAPYTLTYPEYVKAIVTRYKDEPTIMGWMMMNEADTSKRVAGPNGTQQSAMVPFAREIGTLIKSIDSKHLLTVGTQSNGASGGSGPDFVAVHSVKSSDGKDLIDFTEAHDWPWWAPDTEAMPGSSDNLTPPSPDSPECQQTYRAKLGCSVANSVQRLNKPIIMGESGVAARTATERQRRAMLIDAKMNAFFKAGGAGYMIWQWNKVVDTEGFDVLDNTNDPLLAVMKKYVTTPVGSTAPTTKPTPTTLPSVSPRPLPSPTPATRPSPSPSPFGKPPSPTPQPKPVPSPSPVPAKPTSTTAPTQRSAPRKTLYGNTMTGGLLATDSTATQGQALLLNKNSSALGKIDGTFTKLVVRVKGDQCQGYPHIKVRVDGQYVLDTNLSSTEYRDYVTNDLSFMKLSNTTHNVEVIYDNDYQSTQCDRNVWIDRIEGQ